MNGKNGENWWATALRGVALILILLGIRHILAGWLLPNGSFLERLVEQVQYGEAPLAQTVFSGVQEWLEDD